jgi:hypothetical protein
MKQQYRCISLWQPWASLITVGAKTIETRSWNTPYRGPIAIHAAKRKVKGELINFGCRGDFANALSPLTNQGRTSLIDALPFGAIVAVADLMECRPTDSFTVRELDTLRTWEKNLTEYNNFQERSFGDYSPGRFGWVLQNIRALKEPLPMPGKQGFWNVWIDDDLIQSNG